MLESNRGGVDPIRSSKRSERTSGLVRSSKENKRRYLTRSSTKNKCSGQETPGLLNPGDLYRDSNQGVWTELSEKVASELSKSVVSLALVDGHTVLFACSGIAVHCVNHVTRFLTSANLVKALHGKRKDHNNLKVKVRHGDNVAIGFLGEYNLELNVASVNVMDFPDLQTVLYNPMGFPSNNKVVSVGMDISGKLMGTSGILNDDPSGSQYSGRLTVSTFSEVFEFLEPIKVSVQSHTHSVVPNKYQIGDLESLGYPSLPEPMSYDGMILLNNFEDHFGDEYGKGVWSELSETASSNIYENIVALASFNGEKRSFACTGLFIKWNECTLILTSASLIRDPYSQDKIVENLRIEVLRPNKQRAEGTLQHYNLHYNVALISVKDFCSPEPVIIQHRWSDSCELLAVGCCFKSGILMASRGHPFVGPIIFDCEFLGYSECQITKAGIGGPLLDFNGKFFGMNFYDELVGTPYLSWSEIMNVLDNFKTKRTVPEGGYDGKASRVLDWSIDEDDSVHPNSWPVPKPFWCHANDLDEHKSKVWRRRRSHLIDL